MALKDGRVLVSANTDKGMVLVISKKPVTEFEKLKASDFTAASNPAEDLAAGTISADTTSPRIIAVGTMKDGSAVIARRGLGMCEY